MKRRAALTDERTLMAVKRPKLITADIFDPQRYVTAAAALLATPNAEGPVSWLRVLTCADARISAARRLIAVRAELDAAEQWVAEEDVPLSRQSRGYARRTWARLERHMQRNGPYYESLGQTELKEEGT
ncbi:MAG: hypothetical protein IH627_13060 [Rubrivivax sp.]|nr:hypothetical protein [Rubrivivax sp.]